MGKQRSVSVALSCALLAFAYGLGTLAYAGTTVGERNFHKPIPGGNGRACATCHVPGKGQAFSITPAEVQRQFARNPNGPLFRSIDADDYANDYTTVRTKALFRVGIPLPENVSLVGSADREVKIFRAVPSVLNARLNAPYTHDGRAPTLAAQAQGAAAGHSEMDPKHAPGADFFSQIAAFEATLFSSPAVREAADRIEAGLPPAPVGEDLDQPLNDLEKAGLETFKRHCVNCHGGAARNEITDPRFPPGFISIGISELNRSGLPVREYDVKQPDGSVVRISSPDPGRMLITGKASDANFFKASQLRGISKTAPYFHDNSSPDLLDVLKHYNLVFGLIEVPKVPEEEFPALIAYLQKL